MAEAEGSRARPNPVDRLNLAAKENVESTAARLIRPIMRRTRVETRSCGGSVSSPIEKVTLRIEGTERIATSKQRSMSD